MNEIEALRQALLKLDELWPLLFDDLYFVCDQDRRAGEWHVTDHWFSMRDSLERRLRYREEDALHKAVQS